MPEGTLELPEPTLTNMRVLTERNWDNTRGVKAFRQGTLVACLPMWWKRESEVRRVSPPTAIEVFLPDPNPRGDGDDENDRNDLMATVSLVDGSYVTGRRIAGVNRMPHAEVQVNIPDPSVPGIDAAALIEIVIAAVGHWSDPVNVEPDI